MLADEGRNECLIFLGKFSAAHFDQLSTLTKTVSDRQLLGTNAYYDLDCYYYRGSAGGYG